jgi:hypothetical protein
MHKRHYKFVKADNKNKKCLEYQPPTKDNLFYQICYFKNPTTNKYHSRKFVINELGNFTDIQDFLLYEDQRKFIVENSKPYEYKLYSTYDLNYVPYPRMGEILITQSTIMSKDHDYNGYSPF